MKFCRVDPLGHIILYKNKISSVWREMETGGERWREMERDRKRWRDMVRDRERWSEIERDDGKRAA